MKILYIANGNGLSGGVGGSLIRTIEIAKRLQRMGCEIHFLTTIGGFKACRSMGLEVIYHILPASIFKKIESGIYDRIEAYFISTIFSFFIVPRLPKCDICYTDSDYICDIIPALIYHKINRTKWIAMTHHLVGINQNKPIDFFVSFLSSIMQKLSYRLIKNNADKVFVYDSAMGEKIAKLFHSKYSVEMISNGVNLKFIDDINNTKNDIIYDACFVGGLRPSKGLHDIVPIWKGVVKSNINAKLIVVGGGLKEYENELKASIKGEGLMTSIELAGAKSHKECIEIMKQSRIFITPSHEEGWGIAVCEAMACKLPVVAYDLPTYRIFKDGLKTVELFDISKFAVIVNDLLYDTDLCAELGLKGFNGIQQYDWDLISNKEFEIFNKLIKNENPMNMKGH
ncbi:MAG: glycosyltransferase family 4 protein [Candidatus Methanoperedens sp.]|nr:glycosyltransferase family 4 protein [Candidatus Methanoperedens sp.]MCZ7370643.1 glycosyltransferase family 4 protein [Candidatus Methanoperedens sp.]